MSVRDFVSSILEGECALQDVFGILGDMVTQMEGVEDQICSAESELEKLIIFDTVFPEKKFHELLDIISSGFEKNEDYTESLIHEAHKSLIKSDFLTALRAYNLAAAFAPAKSEYGGRLYAGRAKTLIGLERKVECLMDIKTARSFHLDKELEAKLLGIEFKCLYLTLDKDEYIDHKEEYQTYCDDVIFNIPGNPNPILQSGSECIEIVCNEEKGRHIVVTKDMDPGVTVLVEDPYIMLLNDICKWDFKHCSYCLKKIHASVHCRKCAFMSYCDDKCRKADYKNGHQFECACMPFIHALRLPPYIHLCFKILCKAGPKELYKIYKDAKDVAAGNSTAEMGIKGFDPKTGVYNSNSYYQIQNLAFHEKFEVGGGCYLPWVALILIRALDQKTKFFRGIKTEDKSDFMIFVGSKLLYHCHSIPFNGFGVYDDSEIFQPTWEERMLGIEKRGIGNSIYSLSSLLSHSCNPTTSRVYLKNGKMALITNRKLKAGELLTTTYGPIYMNDELLIRQHDMQKEYLFICDCSACKFDWPSYDSLSTSVLFICPDCCDTFDHTDTEEAGNRLLNPIHREDTCKTCGKKFKIGELLNEAAHYLKKFTLAENLVDAGLLISAIPIVLECIAYYQTKMLIPNEKLLSCQILLKKCYEDIIEEGTN